MLLTCFSFSLGFTWLRVWCDSSIMMCLLCLQFIFNRNTSIELYTQHTALPIYLLRLALSGCWRNLRLGDMSLLLVYSRSSQPASLESSSSIIYLRVPSDCYFLPLCTLLVLSLLYLDLFTFPIFSSLTPPPVLQYHWSYSFIGHSTPESLYSPFRPYGWCFAPAYPFPTQFLRSVFL